MCSTFISLNGNALTGPRAYFAMARDGLFPRVLGRIHPRFQTPANAILSQGIWAILLTVAGTALIVIPPPDGTSSLPAWIVDAWRKLNQTPLYDLLYTYVIFGANVFYLLAIASVFVLRAKHARPAPPLPHLGISRSPPCSTSWPRSSCWATCWSTTRAGCSRPPGWGSSSSACRPITCCGGRDTTPGSQAHMPEHDST